MPMPPRPEPNQASAVANEGTERTPPTSAAIGLSATTAIHNAPNETPRITSDIAAVVQEVRVSILGVIPAACLAAAVGAALRRKAERLLESRRVARPDLRIERALDRPAVERRDHLFGGKAAHIFARFARDAGGVRRDDDVVELEQRMFERRRFFLPHVEACA